MTRLWISDILAAALCVAAAVLLYCELGIVAPLLRH